MIDAPITLPSRRTDHVEPGKRPEERLLVCCARNTVSSAGVGTIADLLQRPLDWRRLHELAHRHGVTPLLAHNLCRHGSTYVPAEEWARLKDAFQASARRNLWLTTRLSQVLRSLEDRGIDALSYKGPVIAQCAYGNAAMRRFSDLDVLVAPATMARAKGVLIDSGFRLVDDRDYECSFLHESDDVKIDLHRALTSRVWPTGLGFERLWAQARIVWPGGVAIRTLGTRHTLMVLALEIVKDACTERSKLVRLSDLAELVARRRGEDWAAFLAEAARLGQRRTVLFALSLARDVLDAQLPATLARAVAAEDLADWPARARARLFARPGDGGRFRGPALYLALRERRRDRLPMQLWQAYRRIPPRLRPA